MQRIEGSGMRSRAEITVDNAVVRNTVVAGTSSSLQGKTEGSTAQRSVMRVKEGKLPGIRWPWSKPWKGPLPKRSTKAVTLAEYFPSPTEMRRKNSGGGPSAPDPDSSRFQNSNGSSSQRSRSGQLMSYGPNAGPAQTTHKLNVAWIRRQLNPKPVLAAPTSKCSWQAADQSGREAPAREGAKEGDPLVCSSSMIEHATQADHEVLAVVRVAARVVVEAVPGNSTSWEHRAIQLRDSQAEDNKLGLLAEGEAQAT